jgi:hypothetical protein
MVVATWRSIPLQTGAGSSRSQRAKCKQRIRPKPSGNRRSLLSISLEARFVRLGCRAAHDRDSGSRVVTSTGRISYGFARRSALRSSTQSFRFGIAFCKDLGEFGPQQENLGRVINPEKEDDQRAGGPVA